VQSNKLKQMLAGLKTQNTWMKCLLAPNTK
jgi:hypothetical protein